MPADSAHARFPSLTMIANSKALPDPPPGPSPRRLEVRSVTGACYTLVEDTERKGDCTHLRYHTAYAGLPVVANDDGTFTIVDTRTRLVRVDRR